MNLVTRAGIVSSLIAIAFVATGCPASPSDARAAAPAAAPESPDQVVMDVAHGLSEGRVHVAWDALPASYQQDITELVHSFAAKVDDDLWNKSFEIIRKTGDMLKDQKENILAMPNLRDSSEFDAEKASRDWNLVMAPFSTIAESDIASLSSLRTIDIRRFLSTTGSQLTNDILRISEFSADGPSTNFAALGQTRATLVSQEGDAATVRVETPGEPAKTEEFVRVEGKWITRGLADEWDEKMQEAREQIAQMSPEKLQSIKPQIMTLLTSVEATVDQLHLAQSPEQFEQTAKMGMFQVFGGVMAIAQATDLEVD